MVGPPTPELTALFSLAPFYKKVALVDGLPIVASGRVLDQAVAEAAFLVDRLVGERREILGALARRRIGLLVLGTSEVITDIPENSKLEPRCYWNRRARGAGPTLDRPVATCGEENLLDLDGDPHPREGMFVHEFAHAVQFAAMP